VRYVGSTHEDALNLDADAVSSSFSTSVHNVPPEQAVHDIQTDQISGSQRVVQLDAHTASRHVSDDAGTADREFRKLDDCHLKIGRVARMEASIHKCSIGGIRGCL
jgi:hypothetical protein